MSENQRTIHDVYGLGPVVLTWNQGKPESVIYGDQRQVPAWVVLALAQLLREQGGKRP